MYVSHQIVKAIIDFDAMNYHSNLSSGKTAVEDGIREAATGNLAAFCFPVSTAEAQELLDICVEEIHLQTEKPILEYLLHATLIQREKFLRGYLAFRLYERAHDIIKGHQDKLLTNPSEISPTI